MSLSAVQATLLNTDRWRWLSGILDRWYAVPLSAEDGATPAEIAEAVAAMRRHPQRDDQPAWDGGLPDVLTEWFQLVGHRLHSVQDSPATLSQLWGDAGGIAVWWENQGCWSLLVDQAGSCSIDDDYFEFPTVPLPAALHAMVLSDTLVGVWSATQNDSWRGERVGPLGQIADKVRGGIIDDDAPRDALTAAYEELPVPPNPYWRLPPRGDAETVIRGFEDDNPRLEWMTASDAAFARFSEVVDIDPPGGEYEVLLEFTGLDPELLALVGKPGADRYANAVNGLGHLGVAAGAADGARFYVTTVSPDEVVAALRSAIPEPLVSHAFIAVRPQGLASFRVVLGDSGEWDDTPH